MESYNFLLAPKDYEVIFDDEIVELKGNQALPFSEVIKSISSIPLVQSYIPKDSSKDDNAECYYFYSDSTCIIELEVNAGIIEDKGVEEISVRFAVINPVDTFNKTIQICRGICNNLQMRTIDLRLGQVLDLSDDLQILRSEKAFETKRSNFFKLFMLDEETWTRPSYCGKELYDEIRTR